MSIRTASLSDVPAIVSLSRSFHQIAGYPWGFDADYLAEMLRAYIFNNPAGVAFVIDVDSHIHGFIAGTITPIFCFRGTIATEWSWWVDVEYQGTRHALGLIDRFEKWGVEKGASYSTMATIDDLPHAEKLAALYIRRGYRVKEHGFIKDLTK